MRCCTDGAIQRPRKTPLLISTLDGKSTRQGNSRGVRHEILAVWRTQDLLPLLLFGEPACWAGDGRVKAKLSYAGFTYTFGNSPRLGLSLQLARAPHPSLRPMMPQPRPQERCRVLIRGPLHRDPATGAFFYLDWDVP